MPSSAGGGAGGGAVIFVSRMPRPSIMACNATHPRDSGASGPRPSMPVAWLTLNRARVWQHCSPFGDAMS
jgi:hypothetical protein